MLEIQQEICFKEVKQLVYTNEQFQSEPQFWELYMLCVEERTGHSRRAT